MTAWRVQGLLNEVSDTPRLAFAPARPQANLSAKPFLEKFLANGKSWMAFYRCEQGYTVRFAGVADFQVSGKGEEITINAVPSVSSHTLDHVCQNHAIPLALSLQQKLVLHGSAVAIGHTSAAFIADTGRGKSTLAGSFSSNGYQFLTDDGLFIQETDQGYTIRPSHPSLRLWHDSFEALAKSSSRTRLPIEPNSKTIITASESFPFCTDNQPLGHVYFLGDGGAKDVSIAPIASQTAAIELVKRCFLLGADNRQVLSHNLKQVAALSRLPIFFSLDYPRRFEFLEVVRQTILNHVLSGALPERHPA